MAVAIPVPPNSRSQKCLRKTPLASEKGSGSMMNTPGMVWEWNFTASAPSWFLRPFPARDALRVVDGGAVDAVRCRCGLLDERHFFPLPLGDERLGLLPAKPLEADVEVPQPRLARPIRQLHVNP